MVVQKIVNFYKKKGIERNQLQNAELQAKKKKT